MYLKIDIKKSIDGQKSLDDEQNGLNIVKTQIIIK